jgi:hypothetical protein
VKLYQRLFRDLDVAIKRAYRKHKTVRAAAAALGMPRATFHDRLIKITRPWGVNP